MTDPTLPPSKELLETAMRRAHTCRAFGARTDEQQWLGALHEEIERLQLHVYALTNANKSLADAADGQPPNRHTHEPLSDAAKGGASRVDSHPAPDSRASQLHDTESPAPPPAVGKNQPTSQQVGLPNSIDEIRQRSQRAVERHNGLTQEEFDIAWLLNVYSRSTKEVCPIHGPFTGQPKCVFCR